MIRRIKNSIVSAIHGGLLYIMSGNILVKAISFIASIVVINVIPKADYAYLSYATNIYSYVSLASGLGIGSALLKFCSTDSQDEKNLAYLKFATIFGASIDFFFVLVISLSISFINVPFPQAKTYIYALGFLQVLTCVFSVFQIFLRTQLKNRLYAAVGLINAVIILVVGFFAVRKFAAMGYVIAQYIGVAVATIICFVSIRKSMNGIDSISLDRSDVKALITMGISLMLSNLFSGMMPINETFLVNNVIKDEIIVANFRVAGLLPSQILLISGAIVVYYFPIVARTSGKKDSWILSRNIGAFTLAITFVVAAVGMLLTPWIIKYVYGEKYLDAVSLSYVLWIMRSINAGFRMVPMNMLPAIGKTRFNAWCAALSCIFLTIIDYIMLKFIGVSGVAIGAIVIYLVSGIAFWLYLYKVTHQE